jgi:hypothetical protein
MFSQEEIHTAEQKVETGADFPKFAKETEIARRTTCRCFRN